MAITDSTSASIREFCVVSVEKTAAPQGLEGDDWYRYVIRRDEGQIVGTRRGTADQVTLHAREYAEALNFSIKNFGRSWVARSKKQSA